jgi:hypothetical protein
MLRRFFLAAMLASSMGLFAQYQQGSMSQGQAAGAQPSSPSVVVMPSSPSIYVVGGGLYGTGVYMVNPGTLPTQSTGVSLAGRTGISLETPLQTGAFTGAPTLTGGPIYSPSPAYAGVTPESAGGAVTAESGRLINDMGPSYYAGAGAAVAVAPALSLGEVAAQYRAEHPQSVRTFTNADVQRLTNTVTITGAAVVLPPQQNVPPESPPQAAVSPAPENPPATEPRVSAERTTPENLPGVLPATSTLLPLLGVLGLISSGLGLWMNRFRR